jgi:hypothetical protein
MNEAMTLRQAGMPFSAYSLHFDAPFDTAQYIWNRIVSLAALYNAASEAHEGLDTLFRNLYESVHNSDLLVSSVRLILSGDTTVQFPCIVGTVDEFDETVRAIRAVLGGKPMEEWEEYKEGLLKGALDVSEVDFKEVQKQYADYPGDRDD